MNTVLKVENLSHRYSRAWAIRDVSFEISQTGVIGLLGSNGAGKSTTMNIISGVLNQTEGEVYINGISKRKNRILAKRQVGFLPQNAPLYHEFTVNEYLTYAADIRYVNKKEIKKFVAEAMDKTGITHFGSRLIKNLSGGYRQRVGIAQAILHKPSLVILDEPTNGLDPNQIIEVRKLIKEIAKEHTVLLSSHVLPEISLLCRDIIMIEGGRVVFSESMDAFNNYLKPQSLIMCTDFLPAESLLLTVEGVTKVEYPSEKQCRVFFDGSSTITETMIAMSIQHNWELKEIKLEKSLPDEVFRQLSNPAKSIGTR